MNRISLRRKYGVRHFGARAREASRLLGTLLAPFCSLCLQIGASMPAHAGEWFVTNTVTNETINFGNTQNIQSGGIAFNTLDYASERVSSGGQAIRTTGTLGGSVLVLSGGYTSAVLLSAGAEFVIGGRADATVLYTNASSQTVDSGGVASQTQVRSGAVEVISNGGSSVSAGLISGGRQSVYGYGIVSSTQVGTGGALEVSGRGSSYNATISSGGYEIVSGYGFSQSSTVLASGGLSVSGAGALATGTQVNGSTFVYSGGEMDATTVFQGGTVSAGYTGVASGTIVSSGGIQSAGYLGSAVGAVINLGGTEIVALSGTDIGTTVSSGGNLVINSGGTSRDATFYSGASVSALSGAVISTASVLSGAQLSVGNGVNTYANTVYSGGTQTLTSGGTATSTSISSGGLVEVSSGGLALSSRISAGGSQTVFDGGVASHTVISLGGSQTVSSGGTAVSSLVFQGGVQTVIEGAIVIDTLDVGGTMIVGSGVNVTSTTVETDGVQEILSGGTATSSTIIGGGVQNVSSGGQAVETALGDGVQNVLDGGVAQGTTITNGGVQNVSAGGQAQVTTISDGTQNVLDGGTATSTTLSGGGVQNVSSGGMASATTVDAGGTLNLFSGGTAAEPVVNGGGSLQVMENGVAPIDHLTLNGGQVAFQSGGDYKTLTVGVLDGSGGTFAMRENVAAEKGDLLVVTSSYSGKHTLDIANEGGAHADLAYQHKVVDASAVAASSAVAGKSLSAAASGEFGLSHLVEVGPYKYDLKQGGDGSWYLYTDGSTTGDGNIGNDGHPGLSSAAAAGTRTFGASFMLGQVENQTLSQRLGDVRNVPGGTGAWARAYGGQLSTDTGTGSQTWKQQYSGVQVGADLTRGDWVFGGLFGTTHATPDTVDGSAKVDSYYVGAYATHKDDAQRYVDLVAMVGTAKHDFTVTDTAGAGVNGDVSTPYYQLSAEVGQRFPLGVSGAYVEPQAQLTLQHQNSASFTASDGLQVSGDAVNSTAGRIGVALGLLRADVEHPYNLYLKTSVQQQFGGKFSVDLNGTKLDSDYTGTTLDYGAGFNVKLGKDNNSLAYGEVSRTAGSGPMQQEWLLNLGLKVAW
jgi:outer membrane autotransporter protein